MGNDDSNDQPNNTPQNVPAPISSNPKDEVEQKVETQSDANKIADTQTGDAEEPNMFPTFMKKHFPDAQPHDRWTLAFTAVIAVSTFFYMLFAGWTLVEIHSSSSDTHNLAIAAAQQASHTEEIAQAAQDQVDAANEISGAADSFSDTAETAVDKFDQMAKASKESIRVTQETAKKALDSSIEASRLDQRAWVGIESVDVKNGRIRVGIKNTGKTPAIHIAFYWANAQSEDPMEELTTPVFHHGMFVDYDEWIKYWNDERREHGKTRWPESSTERLNFDDQVLAPSAVSFHFYTFPVKGFLLGKLTYNDLFSTTTRNTKFCVIGNSEPVGFCSGGNGMD
jgi:hypothetical protein